MPYANEPASATGAMDILKDPTIREFIAQVRTAPDLGGRESEIRSRLIDVSDRVRDLDNGVILASDASPYEAIAREDFPSVRVGMLKFSTVTIQIEQYRRLRDRNEVFVDPVEIARLKRGAGSLSIALPGAGVTRDDEPTSKGLFRNQLFEEFGSEKFAYGNRTLLETYIDMLRRSGSVVTENGREGIVFGRGRKSPIDGEELEENLFVPLNPGYREAGPNGQRVYITDALRVHEIFTDEGSNIGCFSRLMSAMEHLILAHIIRCAHLTDPSITGRLNVIVDGPLAIFGEAARFHRSIMSLLHEVRETCRRSGLPGPLVMGVAKTGKIVEHAQLIDRILQSDEEGNRRQGTFMLPIDDEYRYTLIEPSSSSREKNFGGETYYGQNFLVRTSKGKVFDVTLGYPFASKHDVDGLPFREAKMNLEYYGDDINRMLSLIEIMQTDLYANALIPVHLAHRYASIAHAPAGRSLDSFVREALFGNGGANGK